MARPPFILAIGLVLSLLAACSHRDPPKCFDAAQVNHGQTDVETRALADARRREGGWCENFQCGFFVSKLESGEVRVRVEHASAQGDAGTSCLVPVDSDTQYLYSAAGNLEEWQRGTGPVHRS